MVKTRTQKTFVDQDIAVVDMLTLNYLTLKQKFRLSTKTLRAGFIRFRGWVKVPDYIYEYPELKEVFNLTPKQSSEKDKMVTIDSKVSGITLMMTGVDNLESIFIKFKNIPVWYPIQSAFNSPYVFDDNKEVVLRRNVEPFDVIQKLIAKYLPTFNFNRYINAVNLKSAEKIDMLAQLVTALEKKHDVRKTSM